MGSIKKLDSTFIIHLIRPMSFMNFIMMRSNLLNYNFSSTILILRNGKNCNCHTTVLKKTKGSIKN